MRDITIARRALLALAAAFVIGGWPADTEARNREGRRRLPKRKPGRMVVLDPGHGGSDPGAISPSGLYEKTVTLAIARELARQLEATRRYRAALTRRRDILVPLRERVAKARLHHAELFLSLHVDALPDADMRGLSVYTLSEQASDRETAALAQRENKDFILAGVPLSRQPSDIRAVLLDLARRQTNNHSEALARAIVDELGRAVTLLEKPHRSAGFAVLTAPDIPSALIELGCLSNPVEERLLRKSAYQRRLAGALVRAIDDYFEGVVRA